MNLISNLIDIIYPPRCQICGDFLNEHPIDRGDICDSCLSGFKILTHPFCRICSEPFKSEVEEDHLCEKCLIKRPYYDELRSPYLYEEKLKNAIQLIKYSGKSDIVKSLGPLLAAFAKGCTNNAIDMIMIPVPLHRKKLKQRGFNQSALFVKTISSTLGIETDLFTLIRTRYTESQAGLSLDQRRRNVKGAFEIREENKISGKTVILVDDVATTGNTMNECARVLKKAGCEKVLGLTLARTAAY
ncbi:MAG: ComF family protein [Deltaproteobacteria bacterium]|nr:ComF family protein [Deltaproteobacteria bacterium]